jgi:hypothetical protein
VVLRGFCGVVLADLVAPPRTVRVPLLAMNRPSWESRATKRTADLIWLRLIDGVPVDF